MLSQRIVSGLAAESLYALMALGLVLLYKSSDIANFAQGDIAMVSIFVAYTLLAGAGWPMWAARAHDLEGSRVRHAVCQGFGFKDAL